jgi:hypothetical protein
MDHPPDSYRDFADSAIARLATPPFFFYEKVGGEKSVRDGSGILLEGARVDGRRRMPKASNEGE